MVRGLQCAGRLSNLISQDLSDVEWHKEKKIILDFLDSFIKNSLFFCHECDRTVSPFRKGNFPYVFSDCKVELTWKKIVEKNFTSFVCFLAVEGE